jgi:hypothetical protein
MMMMDLNNLQVADWILGWINKQLPKRSNGAKKRRR